MGIFDLKIGDLGSKGCLADERIAGFGDLLIGFCTDFGERFFVYVASFGAFTKTSYSVPQDIKNVFGHFAYILEGVRDLDTLRPYRVRLTADGEVFTPLPEYLETNRRLAIQMESYCDRLIWATTIPGGRVSVRQGSDRIAACPLPGKAESGYPS